MSDKQRFKIVNHAEDNEENKKKHCARTQNKTKKPTTSKSQTSFSSSSEVVETRRKFRGPSKRPCLNRNALMARENRQRKKEYIQKIESKLAFYQQENKALNNTVQKQMINIKRLTAEVAYLKNILRNNSNITALLKSINLGLKKIGNQSKGSLSLNNYMEDTKSKINKMNDSYHDDLPIIDEKDKSFDDDSFEIQKSNKSMDQESSLNGTNSTSKYNKDKSNVHINITSLENTAHSFSDSDHTFTFSNMFPFSNKTHVGLEHQNFEEIFGLSNSTCNTISNDLINSKNVEELDNLIPATTNSDKKEAQFGDTNFNELPSNSELEDLPKYDDILSINNVHNAPNLFTEDELFQNLNNTGICLHVNTNRVSLEFCSICQLNNADFEGE